MIRPRNIWSFAILACLIGIGLAFDCQGQEGMLADPENCQNFYQCVYDRPPFLNSCPPGTLYDEITQICNYPEAVDCGSRPLPDGVTTTTTTPGKINLLKLCLI